jgi:hypothetical protein
MGEMELFDLAEDIAANGQHDPVALDPDGRIIDGRNRYLACVMGGIEPKTYVYEGDPYLLSISRNKHRRHMSTDQIAMRVAQLVTSRRGDNRYTAGETTIADAARLGGVPETAVKSAQTVLRDGTEEEIAAVSKGEAKARPTADRIRARKSERAPKAGAKPAVTKLSADGEAWKREYAEAVAKLERKHARAIEALEREHTKTVEALERKLADILENDGEMKGRTPVFTAAELKALRKALSPIGKPDELVDMFTAASALFNDRAHLLIKTRRSKQ